MYSNFKTYLILFGGVFALSTSAIFVKLADAPSGVTAFYRLFLAALALLPFLLFRKEARAEVRGLSGGQWRKIIAAGLFLALHYVMWFESLRFTSIASSTVLVCLQPLFSLALERVILKSKPKPTAICGCAIALVGSVIIGFGDFQVSGMSLLGDVLAFLAAGVISCYFFIGQTVRQEVSAVTYSVLSYLASAVALAAYTILQGNPFVGYTEETWRAFLGLGAAVHHRRTVRIQPPAQKTPRLSSDHEHPRRTHRHLHPSLPVPPRVHLPTAIGGHRGHHRRPEHLFHSAGAESGLLKKKNDYTMQSYDVVVFWGD